jgi:8-oxo-dGTP pyrophosphatase MutT (NUDIX family)
MHERPATGHHAPIPGYQPPLEETVAIYDRSDPRGRVVGFAPRSVMRAQNLPHAATSVAVRNRSGRIYLHRRTDTKDVFPGYLDVWAGGVVAAGEEPAVTAQRELAEELGLTGATLRPLFVEWYADDHTTCLAHVYDLEYDEQLHGPIRHQPEEVADGGWVTLEDLQARLADPTWLFVPDGRFCLELYLSRGFAATAVRSQSA